MPRWYRQNIRRGFCRHCGPPVKKKPGHAQCVGCLAHYQRLSRDRRAREAPGARRTTGWPPRCKDCRKELPEERWRLQFCKGCESPDVKKAREAMHALRQKRKRERKREQSIASTIQREIHRAIRRRVG